LKKRKGCFSFFIELKLIEILFDGGFGELSIKIKFGSSFSFLL
jgi:hypothetical protein